MDEEFSDEEEYEDASEGEEKSDADIYAEEMKTGDEDEE